MWSKNAQYATWSSKEEPELHGGGSGAERGTISALWLPLKGRSSFVRRPMSQVNWWKKAEKPSVWLAWAEIPGCPTSFSQTFLVLLLLLIESLSPLLNSFDLELLKTSRLFWLILMLFGCVGQERLNLLFCPVSFYCLLTGEMCHSWKSSSYSLI